MTQNGSVLKPNIADGVSCAQVSLFSACMIFYLTFENENARRDECNIKLFFWFKKSTEYLFQTCRTYTGNICKDTYSYVVMAMMKK